MSDKQIEPDEPGDVNYGRTYSDDLDSWVNVSDPREKESGAKYCRTNI